jgi:hypothetical protein
MDPERKREFHTLWQDIKLAGSYVGRAALWWVLAWPAAAIVLWWDGRIDAAFEGLFVVGYIWAFAFAVVALPLLWIAQLLRPVPIWAWLMIVPLFGIWWQLARRRKEP